MNVVYLYLSAIDGKWSEWIVPECSKKCGGGIRVKTKTCTNPKPQYGGKECDGDAPKEEQACNTDPCRKCYRIL